MMKKSNYLYWIAIGFVVMLVSVNIVTKVIIWNLTSEVNRDEQGRLTQHIAIFEGTPRVKFRYTRDANKVKVFNSVDHLLTPAFIISFLLVAVKLTNQPNLFKYDTDKR